MLLRDRYRIERLIARGGYGAVYLAYDVTLQRTCAVKENLAADPSAQTQFEQEALILARLHHPNLPRVVDHFVVAGQGQYLVMDYVEGRNLAEIMRAQGRPFAQAEALPIVLEICEALRFLHSQKPPILHRDIKPQNIIMSPSGRAVLVDFGLSKVVTGDANTVPGARGMTPGYSAPEQYGLAPTEAASDVYALGATLYTMLTGQRPPDALRRVTEDLPVSPIQPLNTTVTPQVERSIMAALEPSVTRRLASIDAFVALLTEPGSTGDRYTHRLWVAAAILGFLVIIAVPITGAIVMRSPPRAPLTTVDALETQAPPQKAPATGAPDTGASGNIAILLASPTPESTATTAPTSAPTPTKTPSAILALWRDGHYGRRQRDRTRRTFQTLEQSQGIPR
jgi:serine/threonine-protein kinase